MKFEFFSELKDNKITDAEVVVLETDFNYEKYELDDIKEDLIEEEQKVKMYTQKTMENLYKLALTFERVREKLANRKNGSFVAWCEHKGFNREYVSMITKKLTISRELKIEGVKAMALPNLTVKKLTKSDSDFTEKEKKEIILSERPQVKLKELLSIREEKGNIVSSTDNIILTEFDELEKIETEISKLKLKIETLEQKKKSILEKKVIGVNSLYLE